VQPLEAKPCHFCGQPITGKKSREHVFPRWLLRFLSRDPIPFIATRFAPDGTPLATRIHPLREFVLGRVCRTCNHGWMNDLERQARPILKDAIDGSRSVRDLDRHERSALARWAVKTSAAVNLATNSDRMVPVSLVRALKDDPLELPQGIFVFAAQHRPSTPVHWLQTGAPPFFLPVDVPPSSEERERLSQLGFRIGLQFGALCLVVVYWPQHAQWPLIVWPELHEPLWPPDVKLRYSEEIYDGEDSPLEVNSNLFLYRALDTIRVTSPGVGLMRLAIRKNRAPHVSGPEPPGKRSFYPVPDIVTPEIDRHIREWLARKESDREDMRK